MKNELSKERAIEALYTVRAYYASLTAGYPKGKDCRGIGDVMCSEIANSCLMAIKALEQQPCEDCIRDKKAWRLGYERGIYNATIHEGFTPVAWYTLSDSEIEKVEEKIKALEQTRWIPVSEKPQKGTYLITGQYGKNRYVDISTFDGEDATDILSWDSYSDEYKVNKREHKVIAYMPLPEPYKVESEEEE